MGKATYKSVEFSHQSSSSNSITIQVLLTCATPGSRFLDFQGRDIPVRLDGSWSTEGIYKRKGVLLIYLGEHRDHAKFIQSAPSVAAW
jgi:hypothetical protein